jgi:glutamate-5-semialdehyde dehydrogenase
MNSVEIIKQLGINAKKAAAELANIHNEQKNKALYNLKENLIKFSSEIIQINNKDIENAYAMKLSSALIDRLTLNEDRINGMVNCLDEIINLKDPTGIVLSEWDRPNG